MEELDISPSSKIYLPCPTIGQKSDHCLYLRRQPKRIECKSTGWCDFQSRMFGDSKSSTFFGREQYAKPQFTVNLWVIINAITNALQHVLVGELLKSFFYRCIISTCHKIINKTAVNGVSTLLGKENQRKELRPTVV